MTKSLRLIELDDAAAALLTATEKLHATLVGEGDLDALGHVYDEREAAFQSLERATQQGGAPSVAVRACVRQVQSLDAEILALGDAQALAIRDERNTLARRRSAIQAHGVRERSEPRVITVKA